MKKERVDIGIPNNPSTGDVLADGGIKINNNFDDIYNKFGDNRLFEIDHGVDRQTIHATGYWQKHQPTFYTKVVEIGSQHDIDTTTGSVTVRLPKLKVGESISIINSNNSVSNDKHIRVQCENTDSFMDGELAKIFRIPGSKINLWGVSDDRGMGKWDYELTPLYNKTINPVYEDIFVKTTGTTIDIANISDFKVIKFLIYFHDDIQRLSKSSEVILHVNSSTRKVYHTEYGVVSNREEEMFDLLFEVNADDLIRLTVKTRIGNNARFIIKSIDTI